MTASRSDLSATNYRLARIIDGHAVRAAAIAAGLIVPRAARRSAPVSVLRMDYWGLRAAADDIFVEFNEGIDDDGNRDGLERRWLEEIAARNSTKPVITARLRELLAGEAEDWPMIKERHFEQQREMREEFCARQPDEIEDECESTEMLAEFIANSPQPPRMEAR